MTHRFVTYNSSYGFGLYLSKPGVDATNNPDPDNFLLHSNFKQEQVLTAGYVSIAPAGSAFVGLPTVLPSPPLFWMNFSTAAFGSQAMPFPINIVAVSPFPQNGYSVMASVSTSGVTFTSNMTNLQANLQYVAMARGG